MVPSAAAANIDRASFGNSYAVLRAIADRVAVEVDRLIPGQVIPGQAPSYPAGGIFCYIAGDAPVTLLGARQNDASQNASIGLSSRVLPANYAEFVFELAHELAHVKMDPRYDNYLVETFAVAVSFRVLNAVGSNAARQADIDLYTGELPRNVQSAIQREDWMTAAQYWQSQIPKQTEEPAGKSDFSFAFLGALILDSAQQPVWRDLLNAGQSSEDCAPSDGEFKICHPALGRMGALKPALRALGYSF